MRCPWAPDADMVQGLQRYNTDRADCPILMWRLQPAADVTTGIRENRTVSENDRFRTFGARLKNLAAPRGFRLLSRGFAVNPLDCQCWLIKFVINAQCC